MDVYEITGFQSGISKEGVNYLEPADSYSEINNGYIYRQVLQSRRGIVQFAPRLADKSRITGIFTVTKPSGLTDLLVTDMNFLYKYDIGSLSFVKVPFDGSMALYAGFNITNNDGYISGTAYPTKNNGYRFVFTGHRISANASGSSIFFYDGTDVKDYTNDGLGSGDNPDYVAPSQGSLQRATHVIYFNERINFIKPVINAIEYCQGWLFSGIRNSVGSGDNFNTPGSGLGILDTSATISGASIFGQYMSLNLSDSNWLLEKTTDAFNPYYPKKLPSVIGTDAPFSFSQWNNRINSIGTSGILGMDFRESLRIDNKIPNFTRDEIDSEFFNLTYGGFDRKNVQFLWSYLSSGSQSTTQDKVLAYNYEEKSWSTNDLRLTVFAQHKGNTTLLWNQIDETIQSSWKEWRTTQEKWNEIGLGTNFRVSLAGDDEGFIYKENQDINDYYTSIN